jgi:hypothetical protein
VDRVLKEAAANKELTHAGPCRTQRIRLVGGGGWSMQMPETVARLGLPQVCACVHTLVCLYAFICITQYAMSVCIGRGGAFGAQLR